MLLDAPSCYRALQARDARFDGRFFVGVSSTGIYCRPVCGVRLPRRENCRFFPSAAAAESGGFRPCLRCRPELAPGFAAIDAPAAIARRAASLIEDGALEGGGLPDLARRVGVTDRHLRRVFAEHFGVSPVQYAQTQRLLLAKRLLTDTGLPVTEVAMASGFASLRRFNALFRERYRLAPGRLRAQASQDSPASEARVEPEMRFELAYRPPLDWDALLGFLSARTVVGVETVGARAYRRVVSLRAGDRQAVGWVEVRHRAARRTLEVRLSAGLHRAVPQVLARIKRVFDLDGRPDEVADALGPLAADAPGLRVPGAFDGFELAVRAILGQQVSVRAAHTVAGRIAARFGPPVATGVAGLDLAFPAPQALAGVAVDELAALGVVGQRARAIVALARAVCDGHVALEPGGDVETEIARLQSLPGIGDWTAQYIAMRALGWPDAFPAGDLVVMRALGAASPAAAREAARAWQPWRAYAVMHLWRRHAAGAGA